MSVPDFIDFGEPASDNGSAFPVPMVWHLPVTAPAGLWFLTKGNDDFDGRREFLEKARVEPGEFRVWHDWHENMLEGYATVTGWMYVPGLIPETDELLRRLSVIKGNIVMAREWHEIYLAILDDDAQHKDAWGWFTSVVTVLRKQISNFADEGNEVPASMASSMDGIEADLAKGYAKP